MAYTPELSMESAQTLRRIAWAMNMPMTKAMEEVFRVLPRKMDRRAVCQACRDRSKCENCRFKEPQQ
jgi:hypothetical protein